MDKPTDSSIDTRQQRVHIELPARHPIHATIVRKTPFGLVLRGIIAHLVPRSHWPVTLSFTMLGNVDLGLTVSRHPGTRAH